MPNSSNRVWVLEHHDLVTTYESNGVFIGEEPVWTRERLYRNYNLECKPQSIGWMVWHFKRNKWKWKWDPDQWRFRNIETDEVLSCAILA